MSGRTYVVFCPTSRLYLKADQSEEEMRNRASEVAFQFEGPPAYPPISSLSYLSSSISTQDPNNTFATATQNAPVTSPASSDALPPPTDAAQSSAYIASLASAGALSAYNSRVANGQPTGVNEPDGATSPLTGTVIAQPPPTSTSAKGTNDSDASIGPLSIGWTSFAAPAVVALATVFGAALVI